MSLACYSHWCSGDEVVEVSLEHGKVVVGHFEGCKVDQILSNLASNVN